MRTAYRLIGLGVCAAALCPAVTLLRYPYLQNVRGDRATIIWTTVENGSASVQYATDRSFSRSGTARVRQFVPSETGQLFGYYQYEAELTGLTPGTEYFYRILVDGQNLAPDNDLRFRTSGSGPFSFLAFGDSGQGTAEQRSIALRMTQQEGPALVLHTGDIAYPSGTFQQFESFYFPYYFNLMKRVPFFPTPGNHEYLTDNAGPYLAVHSVPAETVPPADRGRYYSFDWGNVHFISLDSSASLRNAVNGTGAMLQWLEDDLQKTRQFWRVAYWHHPPYATGLHEDDQGEVTWVRDRIVPILERYNVPLVLNGHEHSYQRSNPIRNGTAVDPATGTIYITTGGGGGSLYPVFPSPLIAFGKSVHNYVRGEVQGTRMTLRAIDLNGQEIDSITLAALPQISASSTVNAASFTPSLAPGELVSIFGTNLAGEETRAFRLPLPPELAGTSVTLNGQRLPLLFVSPFQINAQLPFDAAGQLTLRVTTPSGFSEAPVVISETAPAIFLTEDGRLGAVIHLDGRLVSATAPAQTAEFISVYLTGLGQVNGAIAAGQPAPSSPPLASRAPAEVQFGGLPVTPTFAGLAPGFAGLYQVNLRVPAELPSGTHTLRIVSKAIGSNTVRVAVRSTDIPEPPKSWSLLWPTRVYAGDPAVTVRQPPRRSRASR